MTLPVLVALLATHDGVAAAMLDRWLAASAAAYAHVEADCRFTYTRDGTVHQAADEQYVGSWGRGHLLRSKPANLSPRQQVLHTAWLRNPAYQAAATETPWAAVWVMTRLEPPQAWHTLHPHAPVGLPYDALSYRDRLRRRSGPVTLTAGTRDGQPVWTATFFVTGLPRRSHDSPDRLTLTLTADLPVVVVAARVEEVAPRVLAVYGCDIRYGTADGGWPTVRAVRFHADGRGGADTFLGDQVAEFSRYRRLDALPAERFTLTALGLPEPEHVPSEPVGFPLPPDPAAPAVPVFEDEESEGSRWKWPVIAGIVAVGAVAFFRVGRSDPKASTADADRTP